MSSEKKMIKKRRTFSVWVTLIIVTGLFIGCMGYIMKVAHEMTKIHWPVSSAVEQLKLEITLSHLWLEQALNDQGSKARAEMKRARTNLDKAKWLTHALTCTNKQHSEHFKALDDPKSIALVKETEKQIQKYEKLTEIRWENKDRLTSKQKRLKDQDFNVLFQNIIKSCNKADSQIDKAIEEDFQLFQTLQIEMMVICAFAAALLGLVLHRLIKAQKQDKQQLEAANQQLEAANQQLIAGQQQLKAATEHAQLLARDAENANKTKSLFLANMSHEIRTPMNSIIGFSEMLCHEKMDPEHAKYINIIRENANNLLQLINDILDFSKIEAGKLDIEIVESNLYEILENIDSLLRPPAIRKNIEFEISKHTDLPENIATDPIRLKQCLVNLTTNAIKFTEKGHVHIKVTPENKANQTLIRFDIEDTGIGIPQQQQQQIFSAFSQADQSTTRKFGGTGLGLAITKYLTKLLNGKIELKSQVNAGSTFTITIPANLDLCSHDHKSEPKQSKSEFDDIEFTGHILIVEDNPSNQKLIELLLKKAGVTTDIAENGKQAIEMTEKQNYDLILMDMQMPIMNGYDATVEMRKTGFVTPIIALTANAMREDKSKCIDIGCDEYISKPLNKTKLYEVLSRHLPATHSKRHFAEKRTILPD